MTLSGGTVPEYVYREPGSVTFVVPKGQPRHDQRQQNARGGTPAEALARLAAHFKESIGYPDRLLPTQASDHE